MPDKIWIISYKGSNGQWILANQVYSVEERAKRAVENLLLNGLDDREYRYFAFRRESDPNV